MGWVKALLNSKRPGYGLGPTNKFGKEGNTNVVNHLSFRPAGWTQDLISSPINEWARFMD